MTSTVLAMNIESNLLSIDTYSFLNHIDLTLISLSESERDTEGMNKYALDMGNHFKELIQAHTDLVEVVEKCLQENYYNLDIEPILYRFHIQIGEENREYKHYITLWLSDTMVQIFKEVIDKKFEDKTTWYSDYNCTIAY